MNVSPSTPSTTQRLTTRRPPKCLVFDRRYGWVVDERRDPLEDALAGGRRMFCILPIGKALLKITSPSIGIAACSVVKILEKPDQISPQAVSKDLS